MRIGTRGSALALAQASWVAARLGPAAELVTITTTGDAGAAVSDKSRWVSELEQALIDGRIDLAVHSAKDVPADLGEGLELVAFTQREDPRDVICGAPSLAALAAGARVGTSSLRRAAQIRAIRSDVEIVEIRGNVDTRLRKLAAGEVDAVVLAYAGLARLGRADEINGLLTELIPAAGQGALAIEARADEDVDEWISQLLDLEAGACVGAERDLTHALGASCNSAVGAQAALLPSFELVLRGWVGRPDGSAWLADEVIGPADVVGPQMAERLLAAGARGLLDGGASGGQSG